MKKLLILASCVLASIVIIGCTGEQITTDASGNSYTNYVPNATVTKVANYAPVASTVVGATVPGPAGGIAAILIAAAGVLSTTAAGMIARYKNARLNEHKSMLSAVIAGVEQGNNAATKQAITNVISATPLGPKLNSIVQQITAGITPIAPKS